MLQCLVLFVVNCTDLQCLD